MINSSVSRVLTSFMQKWEGEVREGGGGGEEEASRREGRGRGEEGDGVEDEEVRYYQRPRE